MSKQCFKTENYKSVIVDTSLWQFTHISWNSKSKPNNSENMVIVLYWIFL